MPLCDINTLSNGVYAIKFFSPLVSNGVNIILINPVRGIMPPIGLLYIAAILEREKEHVEVVELPTDGGAYDESHVFQNRKYLDDIVNKKPDLIGFGCLTAYRFIAKEIIEYLKKRLPDTPIVIGGPHPTHKYEEVIKYGADFAVVGDGDRTIVELTRSIASKCKDFKNIKGIAYSDGGALVFTGYRGDAADLDKLPYPAYHLINYEAYLNMRIFAIRGRYIKSSYVFTGIGCPNRCIFCFQSGMRSKLRDIGNVVDEIEWQKNKYNLKGMYILDDLFTISESRTVEFCEEIMKRKIKLKFACQCRVNPFTEKMAEIMKRAGFIQVEFGVESGSQKVLNGLKKGITVGQIERAFDLARKYKLATFANILIGSPNELSEDIKMTKELLIRLKPDVTGVAFITPYPGTELLKIALQNGWIKNEQELTYWHTGDDPDLCINFTKEELIAIRDELYGITLQNMYPQMLKNPRFIFDIIKITFKNGFAFKYLALFKKGKTNEAAQLFKRVIYNYAWKN